MDNEDSLNENLNRFPSETTDSNGNIISHNIIERETNKSKNVKV